MCEGTCLVGSAVGALKGSNAVHEARLPLAAVGRAIGPGVGAQPVLGTRLRARPASATAEATRAVSSARALGACFRHSSSGDLGQQQRPEGARIRSTPHVCWDNTSNLAVFSRSPSALLLLRHSLLRDLGRQRHASLSVSLTTTLVYDAIARAPGCLRSSCDHDLLSHSSHNLGCLRRKS